ncbi:MAG TPA: heme-binding protein [Stellaceae bacterium]|nr:heme-binding protein [Stellaceae bacterium]
MLKLAEARSLADRAIERARGQRQKIAVAVLDELGELVQLDRMEGASPMTADVAEAKARTALNFQKPTAELAREFADHPERREMYEKVARFTPVPLPGGLPILRGGVLAGAIGVAGTDKDDEIARAAIA